MNPHEPSNESVDEEVADVLADYLELVDRTVTEHVTDDEIERRLRRQIGHRPRAVAHRGPTPTTAEADIPVFPLSIAARLVGVPPRQLLRYVELGFVSPGRDASRRRRYSMRDIALLREVERLVADGVNIAGIRRIIELSNETEVLRHRVVELAGQVDTTRALAAEMASPTSESSAEVRRVRDWAQAVSSGEGAG